MKGVEIRKPKQLENVTSLTIPGGESTTMAKLPEFHNLFFLTLGVVFGGLVTSPLYVYPSMPLRLPTEDDYLGIYSIVFWSLSLIGVVKYASTALKADN